MTNDDNAQSIELEIEVPGTPEEVWRAIATGPGITSWYVPHTVEERELGTMTASFGQGPEMQVNGRVGVWKPPHRVVFDGGDPNEGMAFEWLVEAKAGGTCIVRLVNSGFGVGGEWDDHFDAMHEGWQLFLSNLRLHLIHFAGQDATAALPMATIDGHVDVGWKLITERLGLPATPSVGDVVSTTGDGVPAMTGTVAEIMQVSDQPREHKMLLVLDSPVPGTAFIAAENHGPTTALSVWTYLYGEAGTAANERNGPAFQRILDDLAGR